MKKEIEQLIERLADKSLTFGQEVNFQGNYGRFLSGTYFMMGQHGGADYEKPATVNMEYEMQNGKIIGHEVTMLDVLEKIGARKELEVMGNYHDQMMLMDHWRPFGFKTSLNQILENTEWEKVYPPTFNQHPPFTGKMQEFPKDPITKALFSLLINLNLLPASK